MPDFRYRSVNGEGKTVEGVATASDENSLASMLDSQGLILVEADLHTATAATEKEKEKASRAVARSGGSVKRQEIIRFTYNLHAIVSAGVPIVKGLESLAEEARQGEAPIGPTLDGIIQRLKSGDSFSEALALYPNVFPELFVNLVSAGEASGNLESILIELAEYMEWMEDVKGTLKQATVYPAIVLTAVFGLVLLILVFVVPQFSEIFTKMNIPLPLATKILIGMGDLASGYWHYGLILLVGVVVGIPLLGKTKNGRYYIEYCKTRIPLFGSVLMKIALSRFTKNLAVLTNSGVTITESLLITEQIAGNPEMEEAIRKTRDRVMQGETLSKSLSASPVFPMLIRNMVAVGEESGKLGSALQRVSTFYDREVKMGIKRAFAILEPAITIFLAVIVGGIAVAVISTLYKAITMVGK